jgi:amino acid transporter
MRTVSPKTHNHERRPSVLIAQADLDAIEAVRATERHPVQYWCCTDWYDCLAVSGLLLTILGVVGCIVAWIIMSIIALADVTNSSLKDECHETNIWAALCACVVLTGIGLVTSGRSINKDESSQIMATGVYTLLVNIGLSIWKGVELFSPCPQDKLSENPVYHLLLVSFIADMVCYCIVCIAMIILCVSASSHVKTELTAVNLERNGANQEGEESKISSTFDEV